VSEACGCGDDDDVSGEDEEHEAEGLTEITELRAAVVAAAMLVASLIAGWQDADGLSAVFEWAALIVGAYTFVPSTLRRLLKRKIGVGTLMTIASIGAVLLGEVGEAAMLAFLYSISEGLEEYSLARTRRGLRALLSLVPAQTTVIRNGSEFVVSPSELEINDKMLVRPGERIATDGIIASGRSSIDTSAITGESMPVEVSEGAGVFAGSINGTGALEVTVTTTAQDNSLSRIVQIVEAEQSRKGTGQRLADQIAKPLVPSVMIAALLIAIVGSIFGDPLIWIERALVVLVAASPCALAIAVPVTVVAAIGSASKMGVLVKGGAALESLGTIRTVALDKTGTITRNQPAVVEVATIAGVTKSEVLEYAAALEARSEHPLARAILAAVPSAQPADGVEAVTGAGLTGALNGKQLRLGRPGWIEAGSLAADVERMQSEGATAVLVEFEGRVVGAVAVRDELRAEAADVVARLGKAGCDVVMLTGDNERTARALATKAGIDVVHADLRPEDKAALIKSMSAKKPTAMVGDGVNDAPALATADTGIAMGAMGTDVAIETADIALMGEDLRNLPRAIEHARRARRIMWQNVGLSLAIITGLMPLALFGVLGLAAVVAVHEVAEIFVIANGVRAGRAQSLSLQPLHDSALMPEQVTA
jgi:cation-transporting P-type ATPase G